ncbi:MAG TPA: OmpA family protein [Polyangiaceae bacterium]|nr:OmpA family protein [Polyangiaceae bacterium]
MARTFSVSRWLLVAWLGTGAFGCASVHVVPPPIHTDAALGRVVVYRNGVAYFERRATVTGNQLRLEVPGRRLDDFLKSLTVEDTQTGKLVPISFPTLDDQDDEVTIELELPKAGTHELKITYVTESPSWKPSYRLELHGPKPAKLEAWAVVHNVSGEDWKHVAVGVGSTSALSFKYDLRSVHFVDRETLSDETALGVAPPTGGSPYEVANKEVELLGAVKRKAPEPPPPVATAPAAQAEHEWKGRMAPEASPKSEGGVGAAFGAGRGGAARGNDDGLSAVAERARSTKQMIRVEGYAKPDDADRKSASLANANQVRDSLIKDGVPPEQIEVVGTGRASAGDTARVLAVAGEAAPSQASGASPDEPLGDAYFLTQGPLDVEKDHSAMVNVLSADVQAEPVYFYDPISARGSKKFAFRAVLFENPTEHTLDSGPVTVYADGQFLGEGLSDPIQPKSRAFVPFSLDKKVLVETKDGTREEIDRVVTAERGVLTTEARRFRTTELSLVNRGTTAAVVYVRHAVADGYTLALPKDGVEKFRDAYLIPVKIPANSAATLKIEEATPIRKTVDIRSEAGVAELAVFLQASAARLDPGTLAALEQVVELHRQMAELEEKRQTAELQSETYRDRIDELNAQLVSLRRVAQAQALSHNLAQKMDDISQRLQKLTLAIADIDGKILAERVTLEDRLAELTLDKSKRLASK